MSDQLTKQDVARLLSDPSPATRAQMAAKVAGQIDKSLTDAERVMAEDIIRLMARDAVVLVRQTLADNLKASPNLPRDVALAMARDVEEVALPVLAVSQVLTEADLIEVVRGGSDAKQTAIAGREEISPELANALIDLGGEKTVATLVGNEGAMLGEASLGKVLDKFGASEAVQGRMVQRSKLPITVTERLVTVVSESLKQYLVSHHELPQGLASDLILQSREKATVGLTIGSDEAELERLIAQLVDGGRLTPSLAVRALCMGDIGFFECAMARLANIPIVNARILLHDAGPLGLKSIYDRAGMPPALLPAVRIAIQVLHETDFDGEEGDIERHRRRMIERILTQYEDLAAEDIDYLLNKLGDLMIAA